MLQNYPMYPECKYIPTQGRIFRNIILEFHLIIYRIKAERIEVLRTLHSKTDISRIRTARRSKFRLCLMPNHKHNILVYFYILMIINDL